MEGLRKVETTNSYRIDEDNVGKTACMICSREDLACYGPENKRLCPAEEIEAQRKQYLEKSKNSEN